VLVGLGFRLRGRVMVGVRVTVGVKFNVFYFLSHLQPAEGYEIQNGTGRDAGMFCDWTAGKTDKL